MTDHGDDPKETKDWIEALKAVIAHEGIRRAEQLIGLLSQAFDAYGDDSLCGRVIICYK